MRVTIIADDGTVTVDGVARRVDLSGLDPRVHAVQWDGDKGEIEYRDPSVNVEIEDFAAFAVYVTRWQAYVPPPPPVLPPPKASAEDALRNNPALRAITKEMAARFGVTEEALIASMVARV